MAELVYTRSPPTAVADLLPGQPERPAATTVMTSYNALLCDWP